MPVTNKTQGKSHNQQKKICETDLYRPVYEYMTAQGYTVRSEVKNCDMTAAKDGELIVIELKTGFNLKLVMQAVKRQRVGDSVYVAIPKPRGGKFTAAWRDMCLLLRRLEIGLMIVDLKAGAVGPKKISSEAADMDGCAAGAGSKSPCPAVEVVLHPAPFDRERSRQAKKHQKYSIIREMEGRYGDFNEGGSTRRKLMTAYKENCIHIACCLEKFGPMKPAQLKKLDTGPKTQSILSKNFYGWFEKVERGVYALNPQGCAFLKTCPELAEHYRKIIGQNQI